MKEINLVYPELSAVKYKISQFPDGQQNITIDLGSFYSIVNMNGEDIEGTIIKSRMNSFRDLELIICTTKSLRRLGVKEIHLYIPYLLGARSDRKFEEGGNSYLVDVVAPILNSLNFKSVVTMDVHSDVAEACINNLASKSNEDFVIDFAMRDLVIKNLDKDEAEFMLISPDAGALKKIYKLADIMNYADQVLCCSKARDAQGKLSKVVIPSFPDSTDLIIIDDICDGGATFINIAKAIREDKTHLPELIGKLYLIVTHGIFSKGLKELSQYFDGIYTTNSYRDINSMNEFGMHNEKYLHKVHQLNIF